MQRKQSMAILLSILMVASAGCAGWGTDGPAESPEEETDGNGEAQDGANMSNGNSDISPSNNGDSSSDDVNSPESESSNSNSEDTNPDTEETTYTLTVESNSPVTIERHSDGAITEREPTNGTVEFTVFPGSYTISAGGYTNEEVTVRSNQTVALERHGSDTDGGDGENEESQTAQLRVYVQDSSDGDYVRGANVLIENRDTGEQYTGMTQAGSEYDGSYARFNDLPLGTYQIMVSAEGYKDGTNTVELTESGRQPILEVSPESEDTGAEVPPPTYDSTITVQAPDGPRVEDATVTVNGQSKTTNANGQVSFNLPEGDYEATVSHEGYEDGTEQLPVREGTENEFGAELGPKVTNERTLTVNVVDENNNPVAGHEVEIIEGGPADIGETYRTDTNGQIEVTYEVWVLEVLELTVAPDESWYQEVSIGPDNTEVTETIVLENNSSSGQAASK